jgi:hypothetical protein
VYEGNDVVVEALVTNEVEGRLRSLGEIAVVEESL